MFAAIGHVIRLARAGFVLAREGVFSGIDPRVVPVEARLPLALAKLVARRHVGTGVGRLAVAIERLGPSYVKLGQFLATRPDVVGAGAVMALENAAGPRGALSPRGWRSRSSKPASAGPSTNCSAPSASRWRRPPSLRCIARGCAAPMVISEVAVKVLRPGVARRFRRDLSDMYFAARLAESWLPDARRLKPVEVVDTLARSVTMEMDFRIEAAAASEFGENAAKDADFRVPQIDWTATGKDVLTLEWIDGTSLSDVAGLAARGLDLPALGRTVIQSFLRHAMRDGLFHADMHQGNLFADRDGCLVAVDFGIMGRLGLKERRFLAEILYGFITRDYRRVAEVHFQAGYVSHRHRVEDFAQAIRAIGEPIHSRTADQISMAKLLTLLFEITALFDMQTRIELVMLQKTMVVVEGVARKLDPRLDLWATSEPVVRGWIEDNLGPIGKMQDLGGDALAMLRSSLALPELLLRGERILSKVEDIAAEGLGVSGETLEALARAQSKKFRWLTTGVWVLGLGLVLHWLF